MKMIASAIVFTLWRHGTSKKVSSTIHKIYEHQVELLKSTYDLKPDDVDLQLFHYCFIYFGDGDELL